MLATRLSESLGQQVIVENRSGGGGTIATDQVGRSDPDGTTLLVTPLANAVNETLAAKTLKAKFGEQLTGVAPVAETANVLVVNPSLNVKTVGELIALAKSRPPGDILAASSGRGTSTHLTTELFNLMAGIKLGVVHYRGGGDITKDLLSGQVKLMFATIRRCCSTSGPGRCTASPPPGRSATAHCLSCRRLPSPACRDSTCGCGSPSSRRPARRGRSWTSSPLRSTRRRTRPK